MEILTRKSQLLAAELERTSDRLDEATACIQDEREKNCAAKEAIKHLLTQVSELTICPMCCIKLP